jgi:hypothetical protein
MGATPIFSQIFDKYTCPEVVSDYVQEEPLVVDIPLPDLFDQDGPQEIPIVKTANFLNMSILPTTNTVLSENFPLNFHHLSLLPMTELEERPKTVLDACQTDLQVDLVASLVAASALPESMVLADAMENLSLINGLYWTTDGKMWVLDDLELWY